MKKLTTPLAAFLCSCWLSHLAAQTYTEPPFHLNGSTVTTPYTGVYAAGFFQGAAEHGLFRPGLAQFRNAEHLIHG